MKPGAENFFLIMVALILTACTASSSQQPSLTSTSLPPLPTSTSTSVPAILPTPASIVPFEKRLLATIDVKYPDELVLVQNFIWVKTDDGHVIQVDPATNSVVGDIKVDTTSD